MRGMSSFQVKSRVIPVFLSIILIVGGCSSSRGEKNPEEARDTQETASAQSTKEAEKEAAKEPGKEPEKEQTSAAEQVSTVQQSTAEVSKITSEEDAALFLMGDAAQENENVYNPATYAISGGSWDILESGEKIYTMADGNEAKNVWVEDDGKYYYVDFTGCLMKNNYTADGFFVGDEGYWVRKVKQRKDDVEPLSGKAYGRDPVIVIDIMNYSDDSHYAIATRTYSFGAKEEYNVMPLGNSTYLLEYPDDFYRGYLMSVSEDQKTITVSGLGCTDEYTIE